jgi:endo-1,4-beta-D-glucanase Y
MVRLTQQLGIPPEQVNTVTGVYSGKGPIGFSAALLPIMEGHTSALEIQRLRVDNTPMIPGEYYNSVLRLFGQGWNEHHYRFTTQGELIPEWK